MVPGGEGEEEEDEEEEVGYHLYGMRGWKFGGDFGAIDSASVEVLGV